MPHVEAAGIPTAHTSPVISVSAPSKETVPTKHWDEEAAVVML
jgi:hypothetical protein